MDELVKLVSEKTGLPADTARLAVDTVIGYLKGKLPGPIASQIDSLLAGGTDAMGKAGDVAKGLGGLFGKK